MKPFASLTPRLRTAMYSVIVLGVLFALVGATKWGFPTGLSAAVGSIAAATNLYVLAKIIRALTEPGASKSVAGWSIAFAIKLFALFGGLWLLLAWGVVSVLPLAVGYTTLPIGIAIGSLVSDKASED
ncbi:hypothetical protein BH09MYX1_BH09MYX1_16840 [soil metagenome]